MTTGPTNQKGKPGVLVPPEFVFSGPIKFQLPIDIPPSFSSNLITLRYSIKLSLVTTSGTHSINLPRLVILPFVAKLVPNDHPNPKLLRWDGNPEYLYPSNPSELDYFLDLHSQEGSGKFINEELKTGLSRSSTFSFTEEEETIPLTSKMETELSSITETSPSRNFSPYDPHEFDLIPLVKANLNLRIIEARNLTTRSKRKPRSTFVKVLLLSSLQVPTGEKQKTKTVKKTSNPTWNGEFNFSVSDYEGESLLFKIWSKDSFTSKEKLGFVLLRLNALSPSEPHDLWIKLSDVEEGDLHVQITISTKIPIQEDGIGSGQRYEIKQGMTANKYLKSDYWL